MELQHELLMLGNKPQFHYPIVSGCCTMLHSTELLIL